MLKINQEIIGLHRKPMGDVYSIGCQLADATKQIPQEFSFREDLNPDISHIRHESPQYVQDFLYPRKHPRYPLSVWSGVLIEKAAGHGDPRIQGSVTVRPLNGQSARISPQFLEGTQVAVVDAWTSAKNHDDALIALLERGSEVVSRLFPSMVAITYESHEKVGKFTKRPRTLPAVKEVFPKIVYEGELKRVDQARTFLRDGTKKGFGLLLATDEIALDR